VHLPSWLLECPASRFASQRSCKGHSRRRPCSCAPAQVHYGMVLPSGKVHPNATEPYGVPIEEECAVWLHMVNLFTGRDDRSSFAYRTDRSWQWVRPAPA